MEIEVEGRRVAMMRKEVKERQPRQEGGEGNEEKNYEREKARGRQRRY